jgi:hypothetical protein
MVGGIEALYQRDPMIALSCRLGLTMSRARARARPLFRSRTNGDVRIAITAADYEAIAATCRWAARPTSKTL